MGGDERLEDLGWWTGRGCDDRWTVLSGGFLRGVQGLVEDRLGGEMGGYEILLVWDILSCWWRWMGWVAVQFIQIGFGCLWFFWLWLRNWVRFVGIFALFNGFDNANGVPFRVAEFGLYFLIELSPNV